jgi:hypothetical protein
MAERRGRIQCRRLGNHGADDELGYCIFRLSRRSTITAAHIQAITYSPTQSLPRRQNRQTHLALSSEPHGIWDYDFTAAPILADVTVNGRKVKILVETSKQGLPTCSIGPRDNLSGRLRIARFPRDMSQVSGMRRRSRFRPNRRRSSSRA